MLKSKKKPKAIPSPVELKIYKKSDDRYSVKVELDKKEMQERINIFKRAKRVSTSELLNTILSTIVFEVQTSSTEQDSKEDSKESSKTIKFSIGDIKIEK